ncbi:MAG: tyrosine--tRNA ligase, partial [Chloroflexi bacterium]
NYIGITETPNDMFGKVMSIPDSSIVNYFTLVTPLTPIEIDEIAAGLESRALAPMEVKKRLAEEITAVFTSRTEALDARAYFEATVQRKETPDEMPEHGVAGRIALTDVLREAELVKSNGEVRRLVAEGGLVVNGEKIADFNIEVGPGDEIRVGRHRYLRLVAK